MIGWLLLAGVGIASAGFVAGEWLAAWLHHSCPCQVLLPTDDRRGPAKPPSGPPAATPGDHTEAGARYAQETYGTQDGAA